MSVSTTQSSTSSPAPTPSKNLSTPCYNHKTPEKFSDRFTPIRESPDWVIRYGLIHSPTNSTKTVNTKRTKDDEEEIRDESIAYECLLHNELLNAGIEDIKEQKTSANDLANKKANPVLTPRRNLFRFRLHDDDNLVLNDIKSSPYSLSPVGATSQNLLKSPKKSFRKISKNPFKVLDAPELQDDFYLNLVDWSSTNLLSVGLGSCVYLWSACTSQVTRLCDLSGSDSANDKVTSVSWYERGNYVAVGCETGQVQVWDVTATKQINTLTGHTNRVGSLAWNGDVLMSGSRDKSIYQRDIRTPCRIPDRKLEAHKQEVCGLKWSSDNQSLASGGNDNKLYIWNMHSTTPCQAYEHAAAVKAIAWSPHHYGLLASGGGTQDRKIRFWNTLTGQPMQMVDTGSQVCNLAWSKHAPEFVSTHGYSQNQVLVWKYPSLTQVARLTGHQQRVLYLATSPDGLSIVTGAGDETLRFWNVFTKTKPRKVSKSALNLFGSMR